MALSEIDRLHMLLSLLEYLVPIIINFFYILSLCLMYDP